MTALMTAQEVAAHLHSSVTVGDVRRAADAGRLVKTRIGRRTFFTATDVDAWILRSRTIQQVPGGLTSRSASRRAASHL